MTPEEKQGIWYRLEVADAANQYAAAEWYAARMALAEEDVPALLAALDEAEALIAVLRARSAELESEAWKALAAQRIRVEQAEAALDQVRAVCDRLDEDPYDSWADATEAIRAAIDGSER